MIKYIIGEEQSIEHLKQNFLWQSIEIEFNEKYADSEQTAEFNQKVKNMDDQ